VREGCLTVKQAIERGDRRALATRLSIRHSLPMDLAYMAADNRITVRQAVMQKEARNGGGRIASAGPSAAPAGAWRVVAYGLGGLLLVVGGMSLNAVWQHSSLSPVAPPPAVELSERPERPEAPVPMAPLPPPALTVPKMDPAGQIIEVRGPDPRSVLVSFCASGAQAGQRRPVEIVETTPPSSGWRLGIFSSSGERGSSLRAIRIRKDARTSHWIAGDGRNPIPTEALGSESAPSPVEAGGSVAPAAASAAQTSG